MGCMKDFAAEACGKPVRTASRLRSSATSRSIGVLLLFTVLLSGCYDGTKAALWADAHVYKYDSNYVSFNSDCTNFVSQAMNLGDNTSAGGRMKWSNFPGNAASGSSWWGIPKNNKTALVKESIDEYIYMSSWTPAVNGYDSVSWVNVQAFLNHYLHTKNSQGQPRATVVGEFNYFNSRGERNMAPSTPAQMQPGDVYAYNWSGSGISGASHLSIQAAGRPGQPATYKPHPAWHGDLVDTHTNNRLLVFWTLKPYLSRTEFYHMHIYMIHINPAD